MKLGGIVLTQTTRSHAIAFAIAAAAAIVTLLLAPPPMIGILRTIAAYDAAALALLIWYWSLALRANAEATRRRASIEDPGRNIVLLVVLAAVSFGFAGALDIFGKAGRGTGIPPAAAYTMGLSAVIFGWLLIHTVFAFRYARLYYRAASTMPTARPGLKFPGDYSPAYLDFAYFSFVIGMTFQVSDVAIASPVIRRLALGHALISFAYNTAILALVVNVLAGLLQ